MQVKTTLINYKSLFIVFYLNDVQSVHLNIKYIYFLSHISLLAATFFSLSFSYLTVKVAAGLLEVHFIFKIFVSKHSATLYLFFHFPFNAS